MPGLIPDHAADAETALLLPVPAAEPAVGQHRARLDAAARDGVPAHITVLCPFLPPAQVDAALLAELGEMFAGQAAFGFTWTRSAGSARRPAGSGRAIPRHSPP